MKCLRCGSEKKTVQAAQFCSACLTVIEDEAKEWQEQDYLVRWLSTREDDFSRLAVYWRKRARKMGLRFLEVPVPMVFAERVAQVKANFGREKPKRTGRKKAA